MEFSESELRIGSREPLRRISPPRRSNGPSLPSGEDGEERPTFREKNGMKLAVYLRRPKNETFGPVKSFLVMRI